MKNFKAKKNRILDQALTVYWTKWPIIITEVGYEIDNFAHEFSLFQSHG